MSCLIHLAKICEVTHLKGLVRAKNTFGISVPQWTILAKYFFKERTRHIEGISGK